MIKIGFIKELDKFALDFGKPVAYRYIKAYLLKYSNYRDNIDFQYYSDLDTIPDDCRFIAVSSLSQNFNETIKLGKKLRKKFPEAFLLLGGHHISYFPQTLPDEFDIGILFEGEKTFLEVIETCQKFDNNIHHLQKIPGIVYRTNDSLVTTSKREYIEPLDLIPHPWYDEDDWHPFLFSSRGCPYKCHFCSSTNYWGKLRFFSPDYIIDEIEYIIERFPNLDVIEFWDDLVIANKNHFRKIVELIEKKEINKKIQFGFAVRANLIDDEICNLLTRINPHHVGFGAESGSNRILKKLKDDRSSVEINQRALDLLSQFNITAFCSFILGSPSETEKDVMETFSFIENNFINGKLKQYSINLLMPLPGTPLWKDVCGWGLITEPIDWDRLNCYASYKDCNCQSLDEWREKRSKIKSYYVNMGFISEERLLSLLSEFEKKMSQILISQR